MREISLDHTKIDRTTHHLSPSHLSWIGIVIKSQEIGLRENDFSHENQNSLNFQRANFGIYRSIYRRVINNSL